MGGENERNPMGIRGPMAPRRTGGAFGWWPQALTPVLFLVAAVVVFAVIVNSL